MKTRRWIGALTGALVALVLVASPGRAQFLDRGVQISAWVGPFAPLGSLGPATRVGTPVGETTLDGSVGFGGSIEVPIPVDRLSVRGDFTMAPSSTVETIVFFACPLDEGVSAFPNRCQATTDGSLLAGTLDLVYRTEQDVSLPHGVFSLGFGAKHYSFDEADTEMRDFVGDVTYTGECETGDTVCGFHEEFMGGTTDPTLRLGFGFSTGAGGLNLSAEVADFVSIYTSQDDAGRQLEELVHDLFIRFSVGARPF